MKIKKIIKRLIPQKIKIKIQIILADYNKKCVAKKQTLIKKILYILKNYRKSGLKVFCDENQNKNILNMYRKMDLTIKNNDDYIYFVDNKKICYNPNNYSNGTVDYSLIVNYSLQELKNKTSNNEFKATYESLSQVIDLILSKNINKKSKYLEYLANIKTGSARSFDEALQRILFLNSVLWQTQHLLMGLGRLDLLLDKFVENTDEKELHDCIIRFLKILHRDYKFKSAGLYGDTGQIIICGGMCENGKYFCNRLSYIFINAIRELQIPDPKILLRVSHNMPINLIETAVKCIQIGVGCPLLSNDDVIIPILNDFGYKEHDSYNYITSACWEPFPAQVSAELNNFASLNFLKILSNALQDEKIKHCSNFKQVIDIFFTYLDREVENLSKMVNAFNFGNDIITSAFNRACCESGKLMKDFGATYNNFGVTGLGLSNVVDSLIAIDSIVFIKKEKTLAEFLNIIQSNFANNDKLKIYIKNSLPKFGNDNKYVIDLTNHIINKVKLLFKVHDNAKRKIKFGLSSPDYVIGTLDIGATPDGRCRGEPSNVHISCTKPLAYTELISFASQLDYSVNAFNGNVVDFIVSPNLIENNFDKFVRFVLLAIKQGFFQMQLNVVKSQTLIEAKKNPTLYPNLIVRVWGFSAYFNDLPEEFKDVLIERVIKSENVNQ